MQRNEVRTKKWFSQLSSWAVLRIAHKKRDGLAITQQVQFARVTWFAFVSVFFIFCVKCKCNHLTFKDREQKLCSKLLISKMTTRLGATPKGAADKANFPLAPILGPQFMLCVVSQSLLRYHVHGVGSKACFAPILGPQFILCLVSQSLLRYDGVGSKAAIQTPRHPMFSTQPGGGGGVEITFGSLPLCLLSHRWQWGWRFQMLLSNSGQKMVWFRLENFER